jgi:vacuolar-type H+-ATPase subunit E/Vma4
MATKDGSGVVLCEAILDEARREATEIVNRARQNAENLLTAATSEASRIREGQLDQARGEALRRKELILATVPVEAGRMRLARIESLLESVREEVRERLLACNGFECREMVIALSALAIKHMAGGAFTVNVPEKDRAAAGDGLAKEIKRRTGRSALRIALSFDPTITEAGVIVEDAGGRQRWDNRLLERLERMWPELRRKVAMDASFVEKAEPEGDRP